MEGAFLEGMLTSPRNWLREVGVETERGVIMAPLPKKGSTTMIWTLASEDPA